MKNLLVFASIGAFSIFAGACADQSSATAAGGNPSESTRSKQDLQNTGRMQTGAALQAADPSVQVSDGR